MVSAGIGIDLSNCHANELAWRPLDATESRLIEIWRVMRESIYRGVTNEGTLPGGLHVKRRAAGMCRSLLQGQVCAISMP